MEIKDELFKSINGFVNDKLNTKTVRDLKREILLSPSLMLNHEYDGLTLMEFLSIYKISKLKEQELISDEEADNLESLILLRNELNDELEETFYKQDMNEEDNDKYEELRELSYFVDDNLFMSLVDYQNFDLSCAINTDSAATKEKKLIKY